MSTDRPLRILVLNWRDGAHPNAGGAEVYTQRVAMEWIKMGHSVTLFCASVSGRSSDEVIDGVRTIRRGSKHSVYREARRFYRREGYGRYDLVIDEVNTRPFLAPKWIDDTPVIALIHQVCKEVWFYEYRLPVAFVGRFILEPWWLKTYRNVPTITVSQSSANSLVDYGLRNVTVVAEGIDLVIEQSDVKREDSPTCIFVGRLAANKRPDDAIEAFRLVRHVVPSVRLWVIGTGPMEQKIRRLSPPGVEFLGRVSESEKRDRLARAHVLLATSVREGWGLVVTEAAQYGTVTAGYEVPGLSDSISASNGVITPSSPRKLSEAIIDIITKTNYEYQSKVQPNGVIPWEDVATKILETATGSSPNYNGCGVSDSGTV